MMGAGETEERERLIERHLPLVRRLARRFAHRGVELEVPDETAAARAIGVAAGVTCTQTVRTEPFTVEDAFRRLTSAAS